jgi:hypothetical protein
VDPHLVRDSCLILIPHSQFGRDRVFSVLHSQPSSSPTSIRQFFCSMILCRRGVVQFAMAVRKPTDGRCVHSYNNSMSTFRNNHSRYTFVQLVSQIARYAPHPKLHRRNHHAMSSTTRLRTTYSVAPEPTPQRDNIYEIAHGGNLRQAPKQFRIGKH